MNRRFQFSLVSIFWVVLVVGLVLSDSSILKLILCNGLISVYAIQGVVAIYRYDRGGAVQEPPSKLVAAFWVVVAIVMWGAAILYWRADAPPAIHHPSVAGWPCCWWARS